MCLSELPKSTPTTSLNPANREDNPTLKMAQPCQTCGRLGPCGCSCCSFLYSNFFEEATPGGSNNYDPGLLCRRCRCSPCICAILTRDPFCPNEGPGIFRDMNSSALDIDEPPPLKCRRCGKFPCRCAVGYRIDREIFEGHEVVELDSYDSLQKCRHCETFPCCCEYFRGPQLPTQNIRERIHTDSQCPRCGHTPCDCPFKPIRRQGQPNLHNFFEF